MTFSLYGRFRQLEKVRVDKDALSGYLGASSTDGVLRTGAPLTYTDGGNYITLDVDETAVDHDALTNTHNLTTDIDHGSLSGLDDGDHDAVYYTETEIDTWRNSVTQTEMGYLNGVTSDIQTQIDAAGTAVNDENLILSTQVFS